MNRIKGFLILCLVGTAIVSCNKITYRKTPGGMPYKFFGGNDTQQIRYGNVIKFSLIQKLNDSLAFSNVGKPPLYRGVHESMVFPYDVSELWTKLKLGDSIVATQMMDTFIKRNPEGLPPQFKKGDKILTHIKVLGIFPSDSAAAADEEKEKKKWLEEDIAFMAKYLKDKNISFNKTPSGAYLHILNPGTGNTVDSGKYVTINYTGTSFSGVRFDSNTDTSFHHAEPYSFTAGTGQMIAAFDEAILMMKKGSSGKIYIPSALGYGPSPGTPKIKPYEHLIFDIEILDVNDKAPSNK